MSDDIILAITAFDPDLTLISLLKHRGIEVRPRRSIQHYKQRAMKPLILNTIIVLIKAESMA